MTDNSNADDQTIPTATAINRDEPEAPPSRSNDSSKVVSDLVIGPNMRWKDNLYQALFMFVMVIIGAIVGSIICIVQGNPQMPWYAGAIGGAFVGLLVGLFTSGIFLMIFRAVRHAKGKHD